MSLGAGIRTQADIDIQLHLKKSAAWNKMQQELGTLKTFLNDLAKTVGIQKPISEYERLSNTLEKTKKELLDLKNAQKASKENIEQTADATKSANRATIVYTKSILALKNGEKALSNLDERATQGLVAGWKEKVQALQNFHQTHREVTSYFNTSGRVVEAYAGQIEEVGHVSRNTSRALSQLDEETVQLNRSMKAEDELFDELERQYVDAQRRAVALANAQNKTEQEVRQVTEAFQEQIQRLREKRAWERDFRNLNHEVKQQEAAALAAEKRARAEAQMAIQTARSRKETERLEEALRKESAELLTLTGRINKYERSLDAVFRASFRLQMAGHDMMQFSRRVFQFGSEMMNTFGEFEYMLNRAAGAMEIWNKASVDGNVGIADLQNSLLDLSGEMRMFQPLEVAEAMYYWGSTTGQVVKSSRDLELAMGALGPIMKTAAMTNTGYEDTIKGVYSILAQYYNGAISQAGRVTELLFYATQKTAAELPDLVNSFKMVGPVAAANNVRFEDMVDILGRLADLGVRGTMAGRAFRQLFIQLVRPSGPATRALNNLFNAARETVEEFGGKSYYELMFPAGEFVGVQQYLENLARATMTLTTAERNSFLAKIATANELPVLTALINDQIRALQGLESATKSSSDAQAEATRYFEENWRLLENSWNGVVGAAQRAFEALQIQVGSVMADVLKPLIEQIREVINAVRDWATAPENRGVIEFLGKLVAFGAAASGIAGAILVLSGAIMGVAAAAVVAFRAFSPLFATIGAIVTGVVALGDAFIRNFNAIQDSVTYAMDKINGALGDGEEAFGSFADAVASSVDVVRDISDVIIKGLAGAIRVFGDLVAAILELNKTIPIFNSIATLIGVAFSVRIVGLVAGLSKWLAVFAARAIGLTKAIAVLKALKLAWAGAMMVPSKTAVGEMDKITLGVTGIRGAIRALYATIGPLGIVGMILGAGFLAYETNLLGFKDIINGLTDSFRDLKNEIKEASQGFGEVEHNVAAIASGLAGTYASFTTDIPKGLIKPWAGSFVADFVGPEIVDQVFNSMDDAKAYAEVEIDKKSVQILKDWGGIMEPLNAAIGAALADNPFATPVKYTQQDIGEMLSKVSPFFADKDGIISYTAANAIATTTSLVMKQIALTDGTREDVGVAFDTLAKDFVELTEDERERFIDAVLAGNETPVERALQKKADMRTAIFQPMIDSLVSMMEGGASDEAVRAKLMQPLRLNIMGEWIDTGKSIASEMGTFNQAGVDAAANAFEYSGTPLDYSEIESEFTNVLESTWKPITDALDTSIKAASEMVQYDSMQIIDGQIRALAKSLETSTIGVPFASGQIFRELIATIQSQSLELPQFVWDSLLSTAQYLEKTGGIAPSDTRRLITMMGRAADEAAEEVNKSWSEYVDAFTAGVDASKIGGKEGFAKKVREALKRGTNLSQVNKVLRTFVSKDLKKALTGNLQSKQLGNDLIDGSIEAIVGVLSATDGKQQNKIGTRIARWLTRNVKNMPPEAKVQWGGIVDFLLSGDVKIPERVKARLANQFDAEWQSTISDITSSFTPGNMPDAERIGKELEITPITGKPKVSGGQEITIPVTANADVTINTPEGLNDKVKAAIISPIQTAIDGSKIDASQMGAEMVNTFSSGAVTRVDVVTAEQILPAIYGIVDAMSSENMRQRFTNAGIKDAGAFSTGMRTALEGFYGPGGSLSKSVGSIISTMAAGGYAQGGRNAGLSWAGAFNTAVKSAIMNTVRMVGFFVIGNSPPKMGPLKDIDKGGYNVGAAWGKNLARGAVSETEKGIRGIGRKAMAGGFGGLTTNVTHDATRKLEISIDIKSSNNVDRESASEIRRGVYDALVDSEILSHMVTVG